MQMFSRSPTFTILVYAASIIYQRLTQGMAEAEKTERDDTSEHLILHMLKIAGKFISCSMCCS